MKKLAVLIFALVCAAGAWAQPSQSLITVVVQPDRADWTYRVGDEATFKIYALKNKVPLKDITVKYSYGPERFPAVKSGVLEIKDAEATLKVPGMKTPGFQTVTASVEYEGKTYSAYTNIGYEPENIKPTATMPADFTAFWDKAKADASRTPLEPLMTLQPELCTPEVNVYHVRFQNERRGSFIYGMLCIPSKAGKYPVVLQVPGAGLHFFTGYKTLAAQGVITLEIGIHGIPVNLPPHVYGNLASGALSGYSTFNSDNKDKYYFKRVLTGCVRAVDFLCSLDEFDGSNVAVMGGSQGGALAIMTAALDTRVKCVASRHPGMCDMTGYMHGRPGGWPGYRDTEEENIKAKLETSAYYDVVNFARTLKVPGLYTWGYNDPACPPTTTFSAYNVITAPKQLNLYAETAHWHFPEQHARFEGWVLEQLGVK